MPLFLRNFNSPMQTRPCHISVVSPIYCGEKMVAELVNRIAQSMNTIAQTDSVCGPMLTDTANAPADKATANGTQTTINGTPAAANALNTPPAVYSHRLIA